MAQVVLAPSAWDDLARLYEFLAQRDPTAAANAVAAIEDGVLLLERHPGIGRPIKEGLRELIISYGATGYIALYEFRPAPGLVTVFKLRHQRELGNK